MTFRNNKQLDQKYDLSIFIGKNVWIIVDLIPKGAKNKSCFCVFTTTHSDTWEGLFLVKSLLWLCSLIEEIPKDGRKGNNGV